MKILVVEDNAVAAAILEAALIKLGHEPTRAADGLTAWRAFELNPVRVVVSDWLMPGIDGLELCRRIRARGGEYTYFILLSAVESNTGNLELALDAGVTESPSLLALSPGLLTVVFFKPGAAGSATGGIFAAQLCPAPPQ